MLSPERRQQIEIEFRTAKNGQSVYANTLEEIEFIEHLARQELVNQYGKHRFAYTKGDTSSLLHGYWYITERD